MVKIIFSNFTVVLVHVIPTLLAIFFGQKRIFKIYPNLALDPLIYDRQVSFPLLCTFWNFVCFSFCHCLFFFLSNNFQFVTFMKTFAQCLAAAYLSTANTGCIERSGCTVVRSSAPFFVPSHVYPKFACRELTGLFCWVSFCCQLFFLFHCLF